MSGTVVAQKVEERSKLAIWFNNLFRTKLEIETDKLTEMMKAGQANAPSGTEAFTHSRDGLEALVLAKLSAPPVHVKLSSLSVTFWCPMPKALWQAFNDDSVFLQQLNEKLAKLTELLVGEWAKRQIVWERVAVEAAGKNDADGVKHAQDEFAKDCVTLTKECQDVAIEQMNDFFTQKARTFSAYSSYKFKAGVKIVSTSVGLVLSIAALSTASTPAAPATLVPAIIGIVSTAMSIGKQVADLAASAEEIEVEIYGNLEKIEVSYKDSSGKAKKKTYKAREFATGFVGGITGGVSDVVVPSIKSLIDETGLHKSKLDGLEVTLHAMGKNVNAIVDSLVAANQVLDDNKQALTKKLKTSPTNRAISKAMDKIEDSIKKFESVNANLLEAFEAVPKMITRIEAGRISNEKLDTSLKAIQAALGTGGYATAGNILATLALTGIGFAGGLPETQIEKIMTWTGLAYTGLDQLREYGPDAMEGLLA